MGKAMSDALPAGFVVDDLPEGFVLDAANPAETFGQRVKREFSPANIGSAAIRPVVNAATAIPGIFADATMSGWNMLTGQNNQLPSVATRELLDRYTRKPEGVGKGAEFVSSALLGSRIPMPQIGQQAPAGFVSNSKAGAAQIAQDAGYKTLPSMTNPTVKNRMLEGMSGKLKLQQQASFLNQQNTQKLASRSLNEADDAVLIKEGIKQIQSEATQKGYEPVRRFGQMQNDDVFKEALSKIQTSVKGAERSFPGLVPDDGLEKTLQALNREKFDSGDAIDAIRTLRDMTDDAYRAGKNSLGKSYKAASKALEDLVERNLSKAGDDGAAMLANYRDARKLIAKSFTVDRALLDEFGTVGAESFRRALRKGVPLEKEQLAIANFASAFPKLAKPVQEAVTEVSPLDLYGSVIGAGSVGSVAPLAIPFTRVGLRQYLLSPRGQALALPPRVAAPANLGLFGSGATQLPGLFAQEPIE